MKVIQHLAGFVLRQAVCTVSEAVVETIEAKLTDPGNRLMNALVEANDKSWTTIEIILAGEGFFNQVKTWIGDTAEHRSWRSMLQQLLQQHLISDGKGEVEFRRQSLDELNRYRQSGLNRFEVKPHAFAEVTASYVACDSSSSFLEEIKAELGTLESKLAKQYPNLARILGLQLPNSDLPLIAGTFCYYLRMAIEASPELFQGLTTSRLESIDRGMNERFAAMNRTIQSFGEKLTSTLETVQLELQATRSEVSAMGHRLEGQNDELKQICMGIAQAVDQQHRFARLARTGDPKALADARKQEQDFRRILINSLLKSPHRNLDAIWPAHEAACRTDPLFYPHLAAWYFAHGEVRDLQDLFTATLCLSTHSGHREVGLALLERLAPYQVVRVVNFIHGTRVPVYTEIYDWQRHQHAPKMQIDTAMRGLGRSFPKSFRTAIRDYLRRLEADPDRFEGAALRGKDGLKRLYSLLHIKPSSFAQAILFDRKYPEGSRLAIVAKLNLQMALSKRIALIREAKLPFSMALTYLPESDPDALELLIERMSPQELISNLRLLHRRGTFDLPRLTEMVFQKLDAAKQSTRLSTLKTELAAQITDLPEPVRVRLHQLTEARMEAKGRIRRSTALLVDKSGSMDLAIEAGMHLAAMIASMCEADLFVYAFDRVAFPVASTGKTLADWRKAFRGIVPGGTTACGAGIEMLRRRKERVEQIIAITDEVELDPPSFVDALLTYQREMGIEPSLILVRVPDSGSMIQERLSLLGIPITVFDYDGDYYSLPNLVPLLTQPSEQDFLLEVLSHPLPKRLQQVNVN
jgi:hypothetical protein